jgi:hypothetical protein
LPDESSRPLPQWARRVPQRHQTIRPRPT